MWSGGAVVSRSGLLMPPTGSERGLVRARGRPRVARRLGAALRLAPTLLTAPGTALVALVALGCRLGSALTGSLVGLGGAGGPRVVAAAALAAVAAASAAALHA